MTGVEGGTTPEARLATDRCQCGHTRADHVSVGTFCCWLGCDCNSFDADLPSLRRQAAAQVWDAAADYAEGFDEPMAREFRARAAALREGTSR